jgi:hypothetical protein
LYLRIAQDYRFKVVPEFLFGYRQLHGGMSSNRESMAWRTGICWTGETASAYARVFTVSTRSYYLYLAYDCHPPTAERELPLAAGADQRVFTRRVVFIFWWSKQRDVQR